MASEVPPVELYREVAFPRRTIYERLVEGDPMNLVHETTQDWSHMSIQEIVGPQVETLRDHAKRCVLIYSQNVNDYLQDSMTDGKRYDIPNASPPFDCMWFEYQMGRGHSCAEMVMSGRTDEGWSGWSTAFAVHHGHLVWHRTVVKFQIDNSGRLIHSEMVMPDGDVIKRSADVMVNVVGADDMESASSLLHSLTAISFMNCRNVRLIDRADSRTRQQKRDDDRKGRDLVTFKVLEIGGITDVFDGPAAKSLNPGKRSLHICRGHFSEYTEDKPLFGKYSGRFWIPAHTRGTMDKGRVIKDYRILPPVEATA